MVDCCDSYYACRAVVGLLCSVGFFFQAEDGIRYLVRSRGLGDVYKRQVYSRDPDGLNTGDVIDVYYRRSTDNGATWGAEVKLNDDATTLSLIHI